MKLDHFENHKQKYIIFFIIAILVSSVTYFVFKTEAQIFPEDSSVTSEDCPLFFREHFHEIGSFLRPCRRFFHAPAVTVPIPEPVLESTPEVIPENASSADATSTAALQGAASSTPVMPVDATSTPEGDGTTAPSSDTTPVDQN